MYRVIIADDEPLIIRGLRKMMDWKRLGIQIIAEAEDGNELMELLLVEKPDIIISDISMPGMSGLDIIREISEQNMETKVIFVSGFQEFSYAKAAVKYGAVDYLLKPVTVEELEKAIERAKEMLALGQSEAVWHRERKNVEEDLQKISSAAVGGVSSALELEGLAKGEKKNFTGIRFALNENDVGQIKNSSRFELIRFAVFRQIEEYLQENKYVFHVQRDENGSNIILVTPDDMMRQSIINMAVTIQKILKEKFNLTLTVGIGATEKNDNYQFLYKTARFATGIYYFTEETVIDYQKIDRNFTHSFEEYEVLCKELTQKILSKDIEWKQCLLNCLQMIRNLHYGSRPAVESRCTILVMELYKELQEYKVVSNEYRDIIERELERIQNSSTYNELKHVMTEIVEHILEVCDIQKYKTESDVIIKVKAYIQEHFSEDITLEQVAQYAYMNPYYFSTFFKKETGENFKTYLLEVRMKKALHYLMETDMKTYELANSVGYHDVRTFREKFREFYGKSPAQYRKNQ